MQTNILKLAQRSLAAQAPNIRAIGRGVAAHLETVRASNLFGAVADITNKKIECFFELVRSQDGE